MRLVLGLFILLLSACATSRLKDNKAIDDRTPASAEAVECYYPGTHAFNGRRLLALNRIVTMHRERLAVRSNTQSQKLQLEEINRIAETIKYPSVDARWHPDQITKVLESQSKALVKILKADPTPDTKVQENIKYLQTQYGPNLKDPDYWCPERKKNGISGSGVSEPGVR